MTFPVTINILQTWASIYECRIRPIPKGTEEGVGANPHAFNVYALLRICRGNIKNARCQNLGETARLTKLLISSP